MSNLNSFLIKPADFNKILFDVDDNSYLQIDTVLKQKSIVHNLAENGNLDSTILYNSNDQTVIPFYALNYANSRFNFKAEQNPSNKLYTIDSIEYFKFNPSPSPSTRVPNNINNIIVSMFQYWNIAGVNGMLSFSYVKNGVSRELYIAPGLLVDAEGRVLFSLGFRKEIINKFNSIEGIKKLKDFYKAFTMYNNADVHLADNILNENAVLMFSTDFVQKPEYARFYKNILAIFVNGTRYNMDMIVTEFVEKYIYNIPDIPTNHSVMTQFKTSAERNDYFKKVTEEIILAY